MYLYIYAFDEIVLKALNIYKPQIIFVCCGFDPSGIDPLSRTLCHADTFRYMTKTILELSEYICEGIVVISQECGYSETHVPFCGLAVLEEIVGGKKRYLDPVKETIINQGGEILSEHQKFMINESLESLNILKYNQNL